MSLNKIVVSGHLTQDVTFSEIGKTPMASFCVVSNGMNSNETVYFNVVVFGKRATAAKDWLCKGRWVSLIGRVQMKNWTAKDGRTVKDWEIVADTVEYVRDGKIIERSDTMPEGEGEKPEDLGPGKPVGVEVDDDLKF